MWIDIAWLIMALIGLWKGWQQGLIITLFATAAWILGVIAAFKLSAVAATYLKDKFDWNSELLPVLSFMIVFMLVALVVYMIGKALEKVVEVAQLGFINKMLGAVVRIGLFTFIFALFIWLLNQAGFINPEIKTESKTFHMLDWIATRSIDFFGKYLPSVRDIFRDIEQFFESISHEIKPSA